jgi:hypothetical protein
MSQSLTFLEMQDRVNAHIRDSDNSFVTVAQIKGWLNDAAHDIAVRTRAIRREATGNQAAADNTLPLPADFHSALALRLGGDETVEFVDDEVWWSWSDSGEGLTPSIARVFGGNIELYPTPEDTLAYALRYVALPAEMTADADISELPAEWHPRVPNYALYQAMIKLDDANRATMFFELYDMGLPPLASGQERFNPGPITLRRQPGPFDIDSGAAHI